MGYVIYHRELGGYIEKRDGMNIGHANPLKATVFTTRQEASDARPGHHRDMGGSGYSGSTVTYETARQDYEAREAYRSRWWR